MNKYMIIVLIYLLIGVKIAGEHLETITLEGPSMLKKVLSDLNRGVDYEFHVAGRNHINYGQEAVKYYVTPEAAPSGPPTNITYR